jgi:hypothetical protein
MNSTNGRLGAVAYASLEISGECVSMPEMAVETLVSTLTTQTSWPTIFVTMKTAFAQRFLINSTGATLGDVLAEAMIQATIEGEEVERLNSQVEISSFDIASTNCELTNERTAALLKLTVNNCNIEDLFPQHAWKEHQEESAAAAYHSLAALFIRFGDSESALECLKLSDQLEDIPRSLALKGFIAFDRGETIGAVANNNARSKDEMVWIGDEDFLRTMGWPPKFDTFVNGGVQFYHDTQGTRDFYELWHKLYVEGLERHADRRPEATPDQSLLNIYWQDQPSLNAAIKLSGVRCAVLPDIYKLQMKPGALTRLSTCTLSLHFVPTSTIRLLSARVPCQPMKRPEHVKSTTMSAGLLTQESRASVKKKRSRLSERIFTKAPSTNPAWQSTSYYHGTLIRMMTHVSSSLLRCLMPLMFGCHKMPTAMLA